MQEIRNGIYGDLEPLDFEKIIKEQQKAIDEQQKSENVETKSLKYEIIENKDIEIAKNRIGKKKCSNGNKRKKTKRLRKILANEGEER
jgi:hypothetical protein